MKVSLKRKEGYGLGDHATTLCKQEGWDGKHSTNV